MTRRTREKISEGVYAIRTQYQHRQEPVAELFALAPHDEAPDFLLRPPPWSEQALCLDTDPDLFYGDADHREPTGFDRALAITICEHCAVRRECLVSAILQKQHYGIWGGTDVETRARLIRMARFRPVEKVVAQFLEDECDPNDPGQASTNQDLINKEDSGGRAVQLILTPLSVVRVDGSTAEATDGTQPTLDSMRTGTTHE